LSTGQTHRTLLHVRDTAPDRDMGHPAPRSRPRPIERRTATPVDGVVCNNEHR